MQFARSFVLVLATAIGGFMAPVSASDYYVAPNGSDTASGEVVSPFKTIQKGIDTATKPGDVLTIAAGTYHEELVLASQGTQENPIVIKAARKQAVVIDGAQRVTGWRVIDSEHNVWGIEFGGKAPYINGNGRWDMQPRSEQVFVDGKRCLHVKEDTPLAAMTDYTFSATLTDPPKYMLKLPAGINPDTALTEITVLKKLLDVQHSAQYVHIDGLCFRRAMNTYQEKMVYLRGREMELSNCIFELSSGGAGLDIDPNRSRIDDNIIRDNGCLGFSFHGSDDIFEDNLVSGNDQSNYGEWEAGGTKIVGNGHIIRHNRFINNLGGVAIWLDVFPCNNVIEYNYVSGNHGEGIRAEISFHNYIGYNIVENTQPCTYNQHGKVFTAPGIGISVQNSAETVVCNNFVKDNRGPGIQMFTYARREGKMPAFQYVYPDQKHIQWLKRADQNGVVYTYDNLIFNNILVRTNPQADETLLWVRGDLNGNSPQCYGDQVDNNFYWDSVTHAPKVRLRNQPPEVPNGASQWQTKFGMDQHALGSFSEADYANALFSAEYPYAPTAAFPGLGKGNALSSLVFAGHVEVDFAGNPIAPGTPVSMGPFQSAAK